MRSVEYSSNIDNGNIKEECILDYLKILNLSNEDADSWIDVTITATLMPFEKQTRLDEGCPAHLVDFYVYYNNDEITYMIDKKSLESLEVEMIDELADIEFNKNS